jgi:hypothetical protein
MSDVPNVEVSVISTDNPPSGVGEVGVDAERLRSLEINHQAEFRRRRSFSRVATHNRGDGKRRGVNKQTFCIGVPEPSTKGKKRRLAVQTVASLSTSKL